MVEQDIPNIKIQVQILSEKIKKKNPSNKLNAIVKALL